MLERQYQSRLVKRLKSEFPGCIVLKNDANYIQGIPDLVILHKDTWAGLEVKVSADAKHQPNQDYYISKMDQMSYASFVSPENEEQVIGELQRTFCV